MKKIFFEMLISPLTISDNYLVNSIIMFLLGFIAFKVAFKIVGDIGVRGEIGSLLHWTIRFVVFLLLWIFCYLSIVTIKFVMKHLTFLLIFAFGLGIAIFIGKFIYKHLFSS